MSVSNPDSILYLCNPTRVTNLAIFIMINPLKIQCMTEPEQQKTADRSSALWEGLKSHWLLPPVLFPASNVPFLQSTRWNRKPHQVTFHTAVKILTAHSKMSNWWPRKHQEPRPSSLGHYRLTEKLKNTCNKPPWNKPLQNTRDENFSWFLLATKHWCLWCFLSSLGINSELFSHFAFKGSFRNITVLFSTCLCTACGKRQRRLIATKRPNGFSVLLTLLQEVPKMGNFYTRNPPFQWAVISIITATEAHIVTTHGTQVHTCCVPPLAISYLIYRNR